MTIVPVEDPVRDDPGWYWRSLNSATHRYWLERTWDMFNPHRLCWCMLNGSTATDDQDDPTVRRTIDFTKRSTFGGEIELDVYAVALEASRDIARRRGNLLFVSLDQGVSDGDAKAALCLSRRAGRRRSVTERCMLCGDPAVLGIAVRLCQPHFRGFNRALKTARVDEAELGITSDASMAAWGIKAGTRAERSRARKAGRNG